MAEDKESIISDEEFNRLTLAAMRRGKVTTTRDKRQRNMAILYLLLETEYKMTQEQAYELADEVEVAQIIHKVFYGKMSTESGAKAIYEFSRKHKQPQ